MKRYGFRIGMLLVLALVLFAWPMTAAWAQSGHGTGRLTADGDGLAALRGQGTVEVTGNGILWIHDQAGDASIQVEGYGVRTERPNGWVRYSGFHGSAVVSGSAITVALSGYDIHLEATGQGRFVLRGNGSYTVEKDGVVVLSGAWTEGVEVQQLP